MASNPSPPTKQLCVTTSHVDADGKYHHWCPQCKTMRVSTRPRLMQYCKAGLVPACKNLGEPIGEVPCPVCSAGTKMVPILGCALHGKCVTERPVEGFKYCDHCIDHTERGMGAAPLADVPTDLDLYVLGYPGDVGGANTECWHTLKLWRQFGLRVGLIPTWHADTKWRQRVREIGCYTIDAQKERLEEVPGLAGKPVVGFCNDHFLNMAARLRNMDCPLVWLNCMTWLFNAEKEFYASNGPFDAFVFQSQFQQDRLSEELRSYGADLSQFHQIRGAFSIDEFPFMPSSRHEGDDFVVGRISRRDLDKWSSNTWSIYGAINHPRRKARVMAWDDQLSKKCGAPPSWATALGAAEETPQKFLSQIHCLLPINGGARENWPRAGLEAMAAGVPIVAENRWGWKEMVVHGKTGFLANSDAELAEYATQLANNEVLRLQMAINAREHLTKLLANPEVIWGGWKNLLAQIKTGAGNAQA